MDLKGQWQVQEDLESLTSGLTAGQPFLGESKQKRRSLDSSYPRQCKDVRGAMLVGRESRQSTLDFYGTWRGSELMPQGTLSFLSLFLPPGSNPDYSEGFQLHENLNLGNLLPFQMKNFLKVQAKSNQQFSALASFACLDSLRLFLL